MKRFWGVLGISLTLMGGTWGAAKVKKAHCEVELVSGTAAPVAGQPWLVGLRIKPEAGWHTYWKNPGQTGDTARLKWKLPAGYQAQLLGWPAPQKIVADGIVAYGYEHEVVLVAEIKPPARPPAGATPVALDAHWLACSSESCVIGDAHLPLTVDPSWSARLARASDELPQRVGHAECRWSDGAYTLRVRAPQGEKVEFFPDRPMLIDEAAPQLHTADGPVQQLVLQPAKSAKKPERISGTLVVTRGGAVSGYNVDVPVLKGANP